MTKGRTPPPLWPAQMDRYVHVDPAPTSADRDAEVVRLRRALDVAMRALGRLGATADLSRVSVLATGRGADLAGVKVPSPHAETCPWCNEPVAEGRNPETGRSLIHRVDGVAVHGATCYHRLTRAARKANVSRGAYLATRRGERTDGAAKNRKRNHG